MALTYNAGCEIVDMEFIQFHPSAIYTPTGEAYLVSEAVRGEMCIRDRVHPGSRSFL